ncbi:DUF5403 family protein [Streptomyces cacaoi]|uniref:HK97 gp10 family phage protein n=1 Tax=Streptomyces cacaoi TaxID=1898 RepID=A0A4Y3QYF9_STRCI|nr:DUF5403 family protein [Streptomyces cacaoi]GEB50444.1 hypothetical protein SCA03_29950 [Streptomyces cacaoi]
MANVDRNTADLVAGLPEVLDEVKDAAEHQAGKARAKAGRHVETGHLLSHIKVVRHRKGYAVDFDHPHIVSVNYGHWLRREKAGPKLKWVDGIGVIEEALS